jgi:uncharacterized protein
MTGELSPQAFSIEPEQVFNEFVFKLASRCNMQPREIESLAGNGLSVVDQAIGCNQCYEYVGTNAWKRQPPFMSSRTIAQAAERIAEHADAHDLSAIRAIGHGGEALMGSVDYLDEFFTTVHDTIATPKRKVYFSIQTNGLLLTDDKLHVLQKHNVAVGLSLDGDKNANDRHRRDRLGGSTYDRVVRAAAMLSERAMNWGILTVIDPANNPEETLESLAALKPQSISMFPPHANWSSPPEFAQGSITMGEWQTRVFDRYRKWHVYHPDQPEPPFRLPLVDGYLEAMLGAVPLHERISNRYPHELFILPNGDFQRLDTLKSTEEGAFRTPFNVAEHSLDEIAATDPGFAARRLGDAALAQQCLECPFLRSCGGDYYPLRFKQGETPLSEHSSVEDFAKTFRNPSVYCSDQKEYLGHLALFVAQQKQLREPQHSNAAQVWLQSYHKKPAHKDIQFVVGSAEPHANQVAADFPALMGAIHKATSRYSTFPDMHTRPEPPEISPEYIDALYQALDAEQYNGRLMLQALQILSKRHRGRVMYFEPMNSQLPGADYFRTIDDMTTNGNHAIVRALFNTRHMFLRHTDFRLRKSGEYWLVTENAVSQHARYEHIPGNAFVGFATVPLRQSLEIESGLMNPETELDIADVLNKRRFVRVGLSDAPGDVLVVAHRKGTAVSQIDALEEVAARLPSAYHPERLSGAIVQEESGIVLRSLSGRWPAADLRKMYDHWAP